MREGTAAEVLRAFLRLGLTSFGGPIAHLGYFRTEFVERRRWLEEGAFADLVALCQFLPGPASSQVGFALGLRRAGLAGGIAAWCGFTLPSAALMLAFAYGAPAIAASRLGAGALHGLKLVAVAVVAQAVWGMARTLAPDRPRASVATLAALLTLFIPGSAGQVAAILFGAIVGMVWPGRDGPAAAERATAPARRGNAGSVLCLALFAALLLLGPLGRAVPAFALFEAFYRAGALVFGGGHVVLPLLRGTVVARGWVSDGAFLAGYGAAQAVPGPLFSFAAYLGAVIAGVPGAILALAGLFLPGLLILGGMLPFWDALRARPQAQAALRGVNAAVVGVLGAALYDPVWTSSVARPADFALALAGFVLLTAWRVPPLLVVALGAAAGMAL
jgi:chromate transporter